MAHPLGVVSIEKTNGSPQCVIEFLNANKAGPMGNPIGFVKKQIGRRYLVLHLHKRIWAGPMAKHIGFVTIAKPIGFVTSVKH